VGFVADFEGAARVDQGEFGYNGFRGGKLDYLIQHGLG
jgi:hypothetical protein